MNIQLETENGLEKITIIHPIPKLGNRTVKGNLSFGYEIKTGNSIYNKDTARISLISTSLNDFISTLLNTSRANSTE
jgi:hypothetical protein